MARFHNPPREGYIDDFDMLSTCAPLGHPHILNVDSMEAFPEVGTTIADVVATVLYNYNIETLKGFLDLKRSGVRFLRRKEDDLDFCISRKGRIVKVIHQFSVVYTKLNASRLGISMVRMTEVGGFFSSIV